MRFYLRSGAKRTAAATLVLLMWGTFGCAGAAEPASRRILTLPADTVRPYLTTYSTMLGWRDVVRWGIPEHRPVLYPPQSFVDQSRGYAVAGLAIIIAQLALIVVLLVQRIRRRTGEEARRRSEERYRGVVETQTELICRFRPDSTFTFVSDAYSRYWKGPPSWFLGKRFIDLVPSSHRAAVLDQLGRIDAGLETAEVPVILLDGTIGWQHWRYRAIRDARGQITEIQGIGTDITDRKRAEETAGQLEARNTAILRVMPDLMFVLLSDGTYVDYHARDPNLLPAPPTLLIGSTIRDVMPRAAADPMMDALARVKESAEPVIVEYELGTEEKRQFEARFVAAEQGCVVCIVRDMTEARRAQALNRTLAGRLIAIQEIERSRIARELHDGVCQDLAAVSIEIGEMRRRGGSVPAPVREDALLAIERRAAAVAASLRQLSHGLHPTVLEHLGLVAALQSHCVEVERQHRMQVRFSADGDVEPKSRLSALSLFRITQEALRNATRHGHARRASVMLKRDSRGLRLVIEDDGVGFDPAVARNRDGLGLVSIEERARLVDGRVSIQSAPRRGTVLHVRIPAASLEIAASGSTTLESSARATSAD